MPSDQIFDSVPRQPAVAPHLASALDEDNPDGSRREDVLWRVRGDDLSGAGLRDGDVAVFRPAPPTDGDVVLASAPDGSALLGRWQARGGAVILGGLTLRSEEVRVRGVLVEVVPSARPRRVALP